MTNLLYWENNDKIHTVHYIADIVIVNDKKAFKIRYFFGSKDLELAKNILILDIENSAFIESLEINNTNITNFEDSQLFENEFNKYATNAQNIAVLTISKTRESEKEFIWFMRLVRCLTYEDENNDYYIKKTLERR